MSEMRNSEDLSILSDMINIVTSSFNKEIEAMKAAMTQADTRLPSPVTIYIGKCSIFFFKILYVLACI